MELRRVLCLVADGFGVGEMPDAASYGDVGSHTLKHVADYVGGLKLPNLQKLGLGNLGTFNGIAANSAPLGLVGKMQEKSKGKDTTTGHWEISGVVTRQALPTYPDGFPQDLVEKFVSAAKVPGILGNHHASGTAIIDERGEEHLKTGKPILYTSADSVFQLACHETGFGLERLYEICKIAREITRPLLIGRVIARPFIGTPGNFKRTENRRDYVLSPERNSLDALKEAGVSVYSVGKIEDIFDHRGISHGNHTGNNPDSLAASLDALQKAKHDRAFIFTNLVDTDMLYGHRRDPRGYANSLVELDTFLPKILKELGPQDMLIVTSDHGCDPTFKGSDHTREYVPLVVYSPGLKGGDLGIRKSFTDVGATLIKGFQAKAAGLPDLGESFV